mgnify:CR=1 FL=1
MHAQHVGGIQPAHAATVVTQGPHNLLQWQLPTSLAHQAIALHASALGQQSPLGPAGPSGDGGAVSPAGLAMMHRCTCAKRGGNYDPTHRPTTTSRNKAEGGPAQT